MPKPRYDALVDWLDDEYDDDLRWVASFDHDRFDYEVRYIRDDLRTDLTDREFQTIIHRTLAVFNRERVEDVYFHLGDAQSLVAQHERATAAHVYLDDSAGVVVKLEPDASVSVPGFREECLAALSP